MRAAELIQHLNDTYSISVHVDNGKLKTRSASADLDPVAVDLIRANRAALIRFLATAGEVKAVHTERIPARPDRGEPALLSFAQQRLWFIDQFEHSLAYNMPAALRLGGRLDRAALRAALDRIVARHDILRTRFVAVAGEPRQVVASEAAFSLLEHDLRALSADAQESAVAELGTAEAQAAFDLANGPLLRGRLLQLAEDEHVLLLTQHHIVSDGWSSGVLVKEVSALYAAYSQGRDDPLPPLAIQYADYAVWQRERLQGAALQAQLDYWRRQLAELPLVHNLPLDRPRPAQQALEGGRLLQDIDAATLAGLNALAREHDASLFMLLQAAFAVLVSRWSGETDIAIGTPIAGRLHPDVEPLIGFFVNTLVLRSDLSANPRFVDLLAQARATALAAYEHQEIPFEMLVDELKPARSLAHAPLFQLMFTLQNNAPKALELPGLSLAPVAARHGQVKCELELQATETAQGLVLAWNYAQRLFDAATMQRFSASFGRLLRGIVAAPQSPLMQLPLLSSEENAQVVQGFNDTAVDYGADALIHELFEQQVQRTPDATALRFEGEALSYAELDARANRLAHRLIALGVKPDDRVAVCLQRSLELVVALLAVLKAGAAYVPLDPDYPAERLGYMLENGAPVAVLTQSAVNAGVPLLQASALPLLLLDHESCADQPVHKPHVSGLNPRNLAYVIYTSGSTGQPKGVMNEHRGVANRLRWAQSQFALDASDRVLQKTPYSFDVSVWEFFLPLLAGATLVVARPQGHQDPAYLIDVIVAEGISVAHFVPAMLQVFMAQPQAARCSSLRLVKCSGEALPYAAQQRFADILPNAALFNLYGPTEAAVDVSFWRCDGNTHAGIVPIGRPVANTRLYVLDAQRQPLPVGVAGELYIGGVQVARGYINRPELTAERFVADPFDAAPEARLYRTGDLCRWLADGSLEYLGRNDFQVKIRGFRIELGEIEAKLSACAGVREAVVIARSDAAGDKHLLAYLLAEPGAAPTAAALRETLARSLAEYMLPSAFVVLDAWPLSANGKLDRKRLPDPGDALVEKAAYVAPADATEAALVEIWQQVLTLEQVGVDDNFFRLGGHSLLATRVTSQIAERLQRKVPVRTLFERPTIRELAQHLGEQVVAPYRPVVAQPRDALLPLSHAQRRLWLVDQLEGGGRQYNICAALHLQGALDAAALQRAFDTILARHEVLRTRFVAVAGEATLRVDAPAPLALQRADLSDVQGEAQSARLTALIQAEAATPFVLARDCLLRATLVRLDEARHVVMVTLHHIAADGWSLRVLVREFTALYDAYRRGAENPLAPLAIQYADYAQWQRETLSGVALEQGLGYWRRQLAGLPLAHGLPLDRPRPPRQQFSGGRVARTFDATLSRQLRALAGRHDASLFMLLQAAFALLLGRWSNEQDIVIGSPVAGRTQAELEPLIGFFINSLVLRTDLSGNPGFGTLLQQARRTALDAYAHQAIPFDLLVEELKPERAPNHAPLFQVSFSFHNLEAAELRLDGLDIHGADAGSGGDVARYDIELHIAEDGQGLRVRWLYADSLFDATTMRRLADSFETLLGAIVATPDAPIQQLPLLPAQDHAVLAQWSRPRSDTLPPLCAHELFEAHAQRTPAAPALVFDGDTLSYAQLNAQANRVAHFLREQDVQPDQLVGLCVERSFDMAIGLLGILKAGAAYLPLDPTLPEERLAEMLQDAGVEHVLTQGAVLEALPVLGEKTVLPLDGAMGEALLARYGEDNPARLATPQHLAYAIYTSGSSGKPKGVLLEHRGLVNLARNQQSLFGLSAQSRVLAFASMSFDGASWEWLMALASGASLHICTQDDRFSAQRLAALLVRQRITHAAIPPALLAQLDVHGDYALEVLIVAGEACEERLAWAWAQRCRVCNSYGPSEATVAATHADIAVDRPITLGTALANVELQVVNEALQAQPVGVAGELLIGGAGLARGYLNRPELSAERFVAHPQRAGERLYRSGDRVRWLPTGELQFLGRVDDQVKIRGFRIELGEIETRLRSHEAVRETVVVARQEAGSTRLVAYVICTPELELPNELLLAKQWRAHLKQSLPDYMLPAAFVLLERFPLNNNGKVDKRRLPAPDYQAQQLYVAPVGEVETTLAQIWRQLLRVDQIGVHDNFFEMGGDSILAIQVVSRANQAGIGVTTKQLFEAQTVAELARLASTQAAVQAPQQAVEGEMPLLPIQHLFLAGGAEDRHHYNMAVLLQTPADFDATALAALIEAIYRRHDALRLRFEEIDGRWRATHAPLDAAMLDDSCVLESVPELDPAARSAHISARCNHWQASFDLARGPLLRGVYFPAGNGHSGRLLLVVHHIVMDGVSWRVLLADLEQAYEQHRRGDAVALRAKTSSLQQWAQALVAHARSDVLRLEKHYWLAQSDANVPPLPLDKPLLGQGLIATTRTAQVALDAQETQALLQQCHGAYRTQINELLLAGVYLGMREWTGAAGLRLRLDGHGREALFEQLDITDTVGYFTSVYPLVLRSAGSEVGEVVKAVKEQYRAVPEHGIGYGVLRYLGEDAQLQAAAATDENALLEFNYLGQFDQVINADTRFQAAPESPGHKIGAGRRRQHQLGLSGKVFEGQLRLALDYSSEQYDDATMQRVAGLIEAGLRRVIAHCLAPGAGAFTPSDFPLARVEQGQLDAWHARYPTLARLYPATPMQAGLRFESLIDGATYVVQTHPVLRGDLDVAAFRRAWQQAIARHDILRTAFVGDGEGLHQLVSAQVALPWHEEDWRSLDAEEQAQRFEAYRLQDKQAGFDFARAPLLRLALFRLAEQRYQLLWTHHHILSDGWSGPLVYRDVIALYRAETGQVEAGLAAAPVYEHYIAWLQRQDRHSARAYWHEQLADVQAPTALGVDHLPTDGEHGGREQRLLLGRAETQALHALAQARQLTVNTLVQWAWAYLLHRYSGDTDVVFGATISGRPAEVAGIEDMVGLFINTIPVKVCFDAGRSVGESLAALQQDFQRSNDYGFLSLLEIQRQSGLPGGVALFDSLLVFENLPIDAKVEAAQQDHGIGIEQSATRRDTHYALTLIANPADRLLVKFGYRAERFAEATVARLIDHLSAILQQLPQWCREGRAAGGLLQSGEREQLQQWNSTHLAYERDACIHTLFERQAARVPQQAALALDGEYLSYAELERRANRLARRLLAAGVQPDSVVGLYVGRSFDLVVGVLGILKAGAAYLPLDPNYPPARLAYLLQDSGTALVLTQAGLAAGLPAAGFATLLLEDDAADISAADTPPRVAVSGDNLAFVMYTSGSTGQPKGVRLTHRTMVNLMHGLFQRHALLAEATPALQFAAMNFDMSLYEICSALFTGATLVLIAEDQRLDFDGLVGVLQREQVGRLYLPTAMLQPFAHALLAAGTELPALKLVQVAGEALTITQSVRDWAARSGCPVLNLYGPTESHVVSEQLLDGDPQQWPTLPSIGRPVPNVQLHLLDAQLQPVPVGVAAELHIAGDGLARDYLGKPELTAARFIQADPGDGRVQRLYATGDLARWLPDGRIEYIGRRDSQVKLRGFRVEPGEIEAQLLTHAQVSEAAVVALGEGGDKRLVAYVVGAAPDANALLQELRTLLQAQLPHYMVPSAFVPLPQLPLTSNGKLDRRALPAPALATIARTPPQTATEIALAAIWMRLLKLDQLGTEERFFDLGGHSLLATQVVSAVRLELGCTLNIKDVFAHQTLRELGQFIDALTRHAAAQPAPDAAHNDATLEEMEW